MIIGPLADPEGVQVVRTKTPLRQNYSKTCFKGATQKEDQKLVFKTDYWLMQVKSIAECSKRAFCNTLDLHYILLPFVFQTFVLSIFEWPLKTGFTELHFHGEFSGNQEKLIDNQVKLTNQTPCCKYEPPSRNPGSAPVGLLL